MLKFYQNQYVLCLSDALIEQSERIKKKKRRRINPEALVWTPPKFSKAQLNFGQSRLHAILADVAHRADALPYAVCACRLLSIFLRLGSTQATFARSPLSEAVVVLVPSEIVQNKRCRPLMQILQCS
jgi:hypothetical protein